MPLQFKNIAVGNLQDDVSGNNYAANKAVYILNLNNTLAQIFSDEAGTTPIVQDGVNNVTGAKGVFGFWVEAGDYFVQVGANKYRVSITGADYFSNRVDETVNLIVDAVAGRGAYYPVGTFEAGFTYTDINQVGTFGGTDYYVYTGGLTNLPHNVTAGTDPTLSSDYAQVFYGEIDNVQGLRDELNNRALYLTLAEAQAKTDLVVGQYIRLTDRDFSLHQLLTSTPAGNFEAATIGANKLVLVEKDIVTARSLGAVSGGADCSTAFSQSMPHIDVINGDFHITTDCTITASLYFKPGGKIIVNNCNVTISGDIIASESDHILQEVGTGRLLLSEGSRINAIAAGWFGLTLSDPTPAVADDNARAYISAARFAGSLGIPNGVYDSKALRLHTGVCYVDDYDSDGHYIIIPSYVKTDGYGDSSVFKPIPNAKTGSIFSVIDDGANSVVFDNFQIDGDQAQQVNAINGISIEPTSSAVIYSGINHGVLIKEMSGNGIRVINAGMENGWVKPKLVRDSKGHNIYLNAFINSEFESKVRSAKAGSKGLVAETANVRDSSFKGEFDENNDGNVLLSNVGERNTGDIKVSTSQQGDGVFFDRVDDCDFKVFAEANAHRGIVTDRCDNSTIRGVCRANGRGGWENYELKNSTIPYAHCFDNGTSADATYSNFLLSGDSDNNLIGTLMCTAGTGVNRVNHNLQLDAFTTDNTFGEIELDGNQRGADINDTGTGNSYPRLNKVAFATQTIGAGAAGTPVNVTVTGCALGDFVEVAFDASLSGLNFSAWVSATDTVTIQLYNPTSSSQTISNCNVTVETRRRRQN